jgi:aminoglycoside phosphotransferase (APT) family kinase protein
MLDIDVALVRQLVAEQFPQWAGLQMEPVAQNGHDNQTLHLGEEMLVRLPRAERYVFAVEKETTYLPALAPKLPLPVPLPLGRGQPGAGYPFPWSVYRWLPGEAARSAKIADRVVFAKDVAGFLKALYAIDASDGPPAGAHNFHRGGDLSFYDAETRRAAGVLADEYPQDAVLEIWETALGSFWTGASVWVHGDVAEGNLLVVDGRLSAVIDFGTAGVGDPACDLVLAWTFLEGEAREAFVGAFEFDAEAWARARGWALWKALILLARIADGTEHDLDVSRRVIDSLLKGA